MKNVGIIGIGWLGDYIKKYFSSQNYMIMGTVSSEEKASRLSKPGQKTIKYALGDSLSVLDEFSTTDCFFISIPPSASRDYGKLLKDTIAYLKKRNPDAKLIYTSSTSIYGSTAREVDENSNVSPETENANKINEVEQCLLKSYKEDSYILRLSGLVGGERHPVKYMSGKETKAPPYAPINLVHRDDIVLFLSLIFNKEVKPGIYNLCSPDHPEKYKYYEWAAEKMKIEKPYFNFDNKSLDKTVFCKAVEQTGFKFKYESPYEFPL